MDQFGFPMDVTPRQLRAFLAVAEEGGFTAASRRLGWAQSAVSTLVADLEGAIGARLFARTSRRVTLTPAGEAMRPRAAALLADLSRAVEAAREPGRARRLVIATVPMLAATLMPAGIRALEEAEPRLQVVLRETAATEALAMVQTGAADLAVGTFGAEGRPGLARLPIGRDALALFCPAGHALADNARGGVAWRQLDGHREIALDTGSALRELVDGARIAAGAPRAQPPFEVSQITTAVAFVAAGLGVAILPEAATPFAPPGEVTIRPLVAPRVTRAVEVICRDGATEPVRAAAATLCAVLAARVQQVSAAIGTSGSG
jgi:DNA-binding transcriptional LysR family regulator